MLLKHSLGIRLTQKKLWFNFEKLCDLTSIKDGVLNNYSSSI